METTPIAIDPEIARQALVGIVLGGIFIAAAASFGGAMYLEHEAASQWKRSRPTAPSRSWRHEPYEAPPTTERDPWAQYRGAIVRAKEKAERRAMTKRAHSIAEYGELERRKRLGPSGVDLRHYEEEAPSTDEGWAPPTLRSPR